MVTIFVLGAGAVIGTFCWAVWGPAKVVYNGTDEDVHVSDHQTGTANGGVTLRPGEVKIFSKDARIEARTTKEDKEITPKVEHVKKL